MSFKFKLPFRFSILNRPCTNNLQLLFIHKFTFEINLILSHIMLPNIWFHKINILVLYFTINFKLSSFIRAFSAHSYRQYKQFFKIHICPYTILFNTTSPFSLISTKHILFILLFFIDFLSQLLIKLFSLWLIWLRSHLFFNYSNRLFKILESTILDIFNISFQIVLYLHLLIDNILIISKWLLLLHW